MVPFQKGTGPSREERARVSGPAALRAHGAADPASLPAGMGQRLPQVPPPGSSGRRSFLRWSQLTFQELSRSGSGSAPWRR